VIGPGQSGDCRVRVNLDGKLLAVTYGYPCTVNVDPIEKKPLFHFLPGTRALSLATAGCNLHCKNCQNWEISQADPADTEASPVPPEELPALAKRFECASVAYTYTDPIVYYEYTLDGCAASHGAGIRSVLVTAAYINRKPWEELCSRVDAATIDLKSISDRFYRDICGATLKPILTALAVAKNMGVHLEVSNLLIPTLNDKDGEIRDLCRWIAGNLGRETPFHFLRFFPRYQMKNLPPTPEDTLTRAKGIAEAAGLRYVYVGNLLAPGGQDTRCHKCRELLIERSGMTVTRNLLKKGHCPRCGTEAYGVWQ
jgi:pyruvate formate lyase activating enzyme